MDEEERDLAKHFFLSSDVAMVCRRDDEVAHPLYLSGLDGDDPIIRSRHERREERKGAERSHDDAGFEVGCAEGVWQAVARRAEFLYRLTEHLADGRDRSLQSLREFGPLVWGRHQDDLAEVQSFVGLEVFSDHDAAHRVTDEMDLPIRIRAVFGDRIADPLVHDFTDVSLPRRVVHMHGMVAECVELFLRWFEGVAKPGEPVHEDDVVAISFPHRRFVVDRSRLPDALGAEHRGNPHRQRIPECCPTRNPLNFHKHGRYCSGRRPHIDYCLRNIEQTECRSVPPGPSTFPQRWNVRFSRVRIYRA